MAKYVPRHRGEPPSQSWRTFLTTHVSQLASIDFFTVPTATFRVLFVFVVLSYDRRRIVHVNVTAHPTAAWTAQQLREASPWDTAPQLVTSSFTALVLAIIGDTAAATKINLFFALNTLFSLGMLRAVGWAHDRWSTNGMLFTEALAGVAALVLLVALAGRIRGAATA